jgi:hypothetical protein
MWSVPPLLKIRCHLILQAQVSGPLSRDPRVECSRKELQDLLCHYCPLPDHVTLPLALMFEDVVLTATTFSFYDCSAVQALEVAAP